jgi:hypothetical protein
MGIVAVFFFYILFKPYYKVGFAPAFINQPVVLNNEFVLALDSDFLRQSLFLFVVRQRMSFAYCDLQKLIPAHLVVVNIQIVGYFTVSNFFFSQINSHSF